MDQIGEVITQDNHYEIYKWLSEYVYDYKNRLIKQECFTLTNDHKINAYCNVSFKTHMSQIKYPFGYVKYDFDCNACKPLVSLIGSPKEVGGEFKCNDCGSLTSFIGSPEKVGGDFSCENCKKIISFIGFPKEVVNDFYFTNNNFSNVPTKKERYKLYLAMWLELFESVSNEDRKEYITNCKDKIDWVNNQPIIPIEILKEYGF